jgi:transcriptional regulator with XRE-family HTH domain
MDNQASQTRLWIELMGYAHILDMVSLKDDCSQEAIGRRLKLLREKLGYEGRGKQTKFASMIGIADTTWNNYERGRAKITPFNLRKLKRKTGVTSDWIYFGDSDELPLNIARRLLPPEELLASA